MHNIPSDLRRYIRLRQRGEGGYGKQSASKQVSLDREAVDEDDLHGGQLLPALQKVLRNRKRVLAEEFSYEPEDLDMLQVECDHRSDMLSVSMGGKGFALQISNDDGHDRHWHILYEIGMTLCVLRSNREVCARARQLALYPCPTPHAITPDDKWFFIKSQPSSGESPEATGISAYAALSAVLGLPARPFGSSDIKSGEDVLSRLSTIIRDEYPAYWLPELGMLPVEGENGILQAVRTIGRTPSADRLLVQATPGNLAQCLRRDSEGAWWVLSASQARPMRADTLAAALKMCRIEESARIMPFRAPYTVGNDGQIAKWGQLHAHFVMTKNLLPR